MILSGHAQRGVDERNITNTNFIYAGFLLLDVNAALLPWFTSLGTLVDGVTVLHVPGWPCFLPATRTVALRSVMVRLSFATELRCDASARSFSASRLRASVFLYFFRNELYLSQTSAGGLFTIYLLTACLGFWGRPFLQVSPLVHHVHLLVTPAPVPPSVLQLHLFSAQYFFLLCLSGCLALAAAPQSECRRTVQLVINAQGSFLWPERSESLTGREQDRCVWH